MMVQYRSEANSLSDTDLRRIANVLRSLAGIEISEEKRPLVQSRLSKRIRALNLSSYSSYCDLIESNSGAGERSELLSSLTTNVTKFFREEHHFRYLEDYCFPRIESTIKRGGVFRIWSAACSTGEEPYSIAMTILNHVPGANRANVKIFATDIDPKVLEVAKAGIYNIYPGGSVSNNDLFRFFVKSDNVNYKIDPKVSSMVNFKVFNLHDDLGDLRSFDVIFCRNVVIYFSKERERAVWQRLSEALRPGGVLFIGHSERVPADANCKLRLAGVTTYVSSK